MIRYLSTGEQVRVLRVYPGWDRTVCVVRFTDGSGRIVRVGPTDLFREGVTA
jgi:hypothetical protein